MGRDVQSFQYGPQNGAVYGRKVFQKSSLRKRFPKRFFQIAETQNHNLVSCTDRKSFRNASKVIDIARGFGVDAQVVGRVQESEDNASSVILRTVNGEFTYSK
mmetsp:Transcript_6888/g.30030  ORF Transcript_6888/g.30030 Transcript_6888/m.30030 type:complete len:103 (+) Transcript_6888:147-455(+)